MKKKILLFIVIALVAIQFIRPTKNIAATTDQTNHIASHYTVPQDVKVILEKACNDCHSNTTVYPWYNNFQPVAWFLANHINDAKKHLNFDEFGTYKPKKQDHKMEEVMEMVKEKEMPLESYIWLHKNADLTRDERIAITNWAADVRKEVTEKTGFVPEVKK
jgi:hypothetical protein